MKDCQPTHTQRDYVGGCDGTQGTLSVVWTNPELPDHFLESTFLIFMVIVRNSWKFGLCIAALLLYDYEDNLNEDIAGLFVQLLDNGGKCMQGYVVFPQPRGLSDFPCPPMS